MTSASIEKSSLLIKKNSSDSRLHLVHGKRRSKWTDPFIVVDVFLLGAIEIKDSTTD